ncbi:reverse transcriptase domain-containing protein [Tanacetum coccineum]
MFRFQKKSQRSDNQGRKMTSEATCSKEINETGINKNEPPRFEQDVQEKPHDDGEENKSSSIHERTTQPLVKPQQSSIPFPNRVRKEKEEALQRNFLENLKQLDINILFIEALLQIPKYAKYLKSLLEKHKEAEYLAADHLSRFEKPHMEVLTERKIADKFSSEHLMVLKSKSNNDEPWYADFVNYIVGKIVPPNWTFEKKRFFSQVKTYFWEEPYAFKQCADNITRRCVVGSKPLKFWRIVIQDQLVGIIVLMLPQTRFTSPDFISIVSLRMLMIFDVWGLDSMGPFPESRGNKYILVVVDYVSKWVEAQALPTNDARVVVKFLRSLFARFGVLKAFISDRGTRFCNSYLEKALQRYGVTHKLSTVYHPQSNEKTKVTNRAIKCILKRSVRYNPKGWSEKLNDALWAFRTAYKTPTGCTPFRLVYGEACHLPVEIEHKAHWALKQCNLDLTLASKIHLMQLNELAN